MNKFHMEAIDRLLEGTISREDFQSLQDTMRTDPLVLQYYKEQAEINSRLEWMMGEFSSTEQTVGKVLDFNKERSRVGKVWKVGAVAAAVALAGSLAIALLSDTSSNKINQEMADVDDATVPEPVQKALNSEIGTVARVTNLRNARSSTHEYKLGEWVEPSTLKLDSGQVQLTLDSGAQLTMKANTEIKLIDPYHVELVKGGLHVKVPNTQKEFSVQLEGNKLSTESGNYVVSTKLQEKNTLQVYKGLVTLSRDDLLMDISESERYSLAEEVVFLGNKGKPSDPVWTPGKGKQLHYIHWDFEQFEQSNEDEPFFVSDGNWYKGDEFVLSKSHLLDVPPSKEVHQNQGKHGNAMRLAGRGAYFESDFKGIEGDEERTISCWVKTPKNADPRQAYSIVSWGLVKSNGTKFQICWHTGRDGSHGKKGALRVETGHTGYVVGETQINDGRWHHIACVVLPKQGEKERNAVKLYVDGQMEAITGFEPMKVNTKVREPKSIPLSLGLRLERVNRDGGAKMHSNFKGEIDELYIFDAALSPAQIKQLYLENKPPETVAIGTEE